MINIFHDIDQKYGRPALRLIRRTSHAHKSSHVTRTTSPFACVLRTVLFQDTFGSDHQYQLKALAE